MCEPTPPPAAKPDADKLAKQLQDSLAKRRLTPWKPVLAVLGLCTLLLALLAWMLYPHQALPLMQLLVFDDVCTPAETPLARAQLYPPPDDDSPAHLAGRSVLFQGAAFTEPGGVQVKSDAEGRARAKMPRVAEPTTLEFLVKHYEDARGLKMTPPLVGRVFVWPPDARVLIVDADETLIAKKLDGPALAALKKAAAAGWRIVYLSVAATQPEAYQQTRSWLEQQEADAELPAGPMLARRAYPCDESAEQSRRERLQDLSKRFTGPMIVIVKTAESAALCAELRLKTIVIGNAKAPPGAVRVPSWADVPGQLK